MTKKWHQIVARGRVMTEEVYAENEQVRCKASRSEKREPEEILPPALSLFGRMMLHVEELFEFWEFRDSYGFEVEQFS